MPERRTVELVAALIAVVPAAIHLGLGVFNWTRYATIGLLFPPDYRWPLMLFSGLAVVLGIAWAPQFEDHRPLYLGGMAILLGWAISYFTWHAFGHRPLIFWGPGAPHQAITVQFVLDHLFAGTLEFVAAVTEIVGAGLLGWLAISEGKSEA